MSDPMNPYGATGPMPAESLRYQNAPEQAAPSQVLTAVKVMFARAGVAALSLVALVATKDSLLAQVQATNPAFTAQQAATATNAAVTIGVVVGVISIVLFSLLALQVRKGRNWARIVTFVFVGLSLLGGLFGLFQDAPALTRVIALVVLVLDVAIVYLLAHKNSNEFFASRR